MAMEMIKWIGSKPSSGTPASATRTFDNHTLFIPAVSVGNVGQLTIDLVLENAENVGDGGASVGGTKPKKIGQIFHPGLEPVVAVANNDSACKDNVPVQDCLITACEIFHCAEQRWVILQLHSPVRKRELQKFTAFLVNWVKEANFLNVLCFSSIFASERLDAQIMGTASRIQVLYSDKIADSYLEKVKLFGWNRLLSPLLSTKSPDQIKPKELIEENLTSVNLSGSGITKDLLQLCQSNGIPCLSLIVYASDGCDNTIDAIRLYKEASKLFVESKSVQQKIKIPNIWYSHLGLSPKLVPDEDEIASLIDLAVLTEAEGRGENNMGKGHRNKQKGRDSNSSESGPPNTIF